MTSSTNNSPTRQKVFPATVVKVLADDKRLVINRGSEHGIRKGQKVLVYSLSNEEIKDPNSGESLGYLEIYKGTGKIIHIQEKMSTIESDKVEHEMQKIQKPSFMGIGEETYSYTKILGFDDPVEGDQVKPI